MFTDRPRGTLGTLCLLCLLCCIDVEIISCIRLPSVANYGVDFLILAVGGGVGGMCDLAVSHYFKSSNSLLFCWQGKVITGPWTGSAWTSLDSLGGHYRFPHFYVGRGNY